MFVRLRDLPSGRSEIDEIQLSLRVCRSPSIVWDDIPVLSEEEGVEKGLDHMVKEEQVSDE